MALSSPPLGGRGIVPEGRRSQPEVNCTLRRQNCTGIMGNINNKNRKGNEHILGYFIAFCGVSKSSFKWNKEKREKNEAFASLREAFGGVHYASAVAMVIWGLSSPLQTVVFHRNFYVFMRREFWWRIYRPRSCGVASGLFGVLSCRGRLRFFFGLVRTKLTGTPWGPLVGRGKESL